MADPTLTTEVVDPNLSNQSFVDSLNGNVQTILNNLGTQGLFGKVSDTQLNAARFNNSTAAAANELIALGLGGLTGNQLAEKVKDAGFVSQYGLGKTSSYADLAKNALRADPNFDPSNVSAINKFAADIQKRGYTNKDAADISNLAVNSSIQDAVNQAKNPTQGKTADQLAGYNTSVKGVFNQIMGRDPTANETDFFSKELAGGTSPYELEQALQTAPEYVQKQNDIQSQKNTAASNSALDALNTSLQQTQQQAFERAQPQIIASYMKAGRLNSSGLNSALAQAQQQLEQQRQSFIGQAGYQNAVTQQGYNQQGYVNNQQNAFDQYLRQNDPANQQRYQANAGQNYLNYQAPLNYQQRQYGLADQANQRAYDLQNYQMQQNDYMRYLNSNKMSSGQGAFRGAEAGAGAGASFGPWGALIGAGLGAFGGSQSTRY